MSVVIESMVHDDFLKNNDGLLVRPNAREGPGSFDAGLGMFEPERSGNAVAAWPAIADETNRDGARRPLGLSAGGTAAEEAAARCRTDAAAFPREADFTKDGRRNTLGCGAGEGATTDCDTGRVRWLSPVGSFAVAGRALDEGAIAAPAGGRSRRFAGWTVLVPTLTDVSAATGASSPPSELDRPELAREPGREVPPELDDDFVGSAASQPIFKNCLELRDNDAGFKAAGGGRMESLDLFSGFSFGFGVKIGAGSTVTDIVESDAFQ